MKILKALILITLIFTVARSQQRSMADATYALKGPVRSFRIEVTTFVPKDGNYVEGPKIVQSEAFFNPDGNRTDYYIYNPKGILVRRIEMKFDGRRMTECLNYDGAGRVWLRTVNTYDDAGRLKEETNYNGDGSLRSKTNFKRNSKGQLIESTEYSAAGVLLEHFTYKYEGATVHSWERQIFGQDGVLQTLEVYIAPNRKEFTNYRPDGSVADKSMRIGQEIAHYNADGSLQKFTTISDQGRLLDELNLKPADSPSRQSQIPDDVDTHGNWTRQTQWLTDARTTRPLKTTYRTITYYDK